MFGTQICIPTQERGNEGKITNPITVGATLVVAQNDIIAVIEKGQPQGIAPTQNQR